MGSKIWSMTTAKHLVPSTTFKYTFLSGQAKNLYYPSASLCMSSGLSHWKLLITIFVLILEKQSIRTLYHGIHSQIFRTWGPKYTLMPQLSQSSQFNEFCHPESKCTYLIRIQKLRVGDYIISWMGVIYEYLNLEFN